MSIPGMTPPMGGLGGAGNQTAGMNEQEQAMVKMVRDLSPAPRIAHLI